MKSGEAFLILLCRSMPPKSKDSPWKTSRGYLFFQIEEASLVYLKWRRYMTKIFYGLPICLAQTGPVNIVVVVNVEFSGNSKLVIDSTSFKQLMDMADEN